MGEGGWEKGDGRMEMRAGERDGRCERGQIANG